MFRTFQTDSGGRVSTMSLTSLGPGMHLTVKVILHDFGVPSLVPSCPTHPLLSFRNLTPLETIFTVKCR